MSIVNKSSQRYSRFDPRSLGNCALWLDAADTRTLTLSGANVTQWRDKSGNGKNATTGLGNVTTSTPINGLNTLRFAGTGSTLNVSNFTVTQSQTSIFWVMRGVTAPSSGNYGYFVFGRSADNYGAVNNESFFVYYFISTSVYYIGVAGAGGERDYGGTASPNPFLNTTRIITAFGNGGGWLSGTSQAITTAYNSGNPSNTLLNSAQTYQIGGRPGTDAYAFDLAELIVYDTASLTTSERQQVEGYLAWKWGTTSTFTPTSISGLSLWLDAADAGTLTLSGSNVTAWANKAGSPNATTPSGTVTVSPTPQNGISPVRFANSSYLTLSNFVYSTNNPTFFYVIRGITSGSGAGYFLLDSASANYIVSTVYTSSGGQGFIGIVATWTAESQFNFSPNTLFVNTTKMVSASKTAAYIDGAALSLSSNGNPGGLTGTVTMTVGSSRADARSYDLCEFIVYSSSVTDTQRQQVEDYLSRKWNITLSRTILNLPTAHPFRTSPPFLRPFLPTDFSNCALWLDAADRSTMAFSGSAITAWSNKASTSFNFSNNSTSTPWAFAASNCPTLTSNGLNGLPVVTFTSGSNQVLAAPDIFGGNQGANYTMCGVATTVVGRGFDGYGNGWSIQFKPDTHYVVLVTTNQAAYFASGTSAPLHSATLTQTGSNATIVFSSAGTLSSNTVPNYTLRSSSIGFTLNMTNNNSVYGSGYIAEYIVYTSVLTNVQRQTVEAYLANKWGLRSSTPSTHLARITPGLTLQFNPTFFSSCALWFDGADPTTLTFSGSNVTAWADKSGNGRNATVSSGANGPTYSSKTLQFRSTSTQSLTIAQAFGSALVGQKFTLLFVGRRWQNGYNMFLSGEAQFNLGNLFVGYNSSNLVYYEYYGNPTASGTIPVFTSPEPLGMVEFESTSSVTQIGFNGTMLASSTAANLTSYTNPTMGRRYGGSAQVVYHNFDLCEFVAFVSNLSVSQRQVVEGYLAWKWGLQGFLSSTHPYRTSFPL